MSRILFLSVTVLIMTFSSQEPSASETQLAIVALGDSTTAGTPGFMSPREAPPEGRGNPESQYAYWMMKVRPEWKVLNRGVRGQRTDQILKRFEYDVLRDNPQAVIVLAGVNDLHQGYPAEHVKENLKKIYGRAEAHSIRVMACTILPYNLAEPGVHAKIREVNEWIRSYAAQKGFGFCDTYGALHDPERPGMLLGSPDDVHPDAAGYRRMAEEITEALEKKLKEWGLWNEG